MNTSTIPHDLEIDRCNQRGGRMLSVVDLLDAGTLSRELADYALATIGHGASFMVGAVPGGAGKTTVMGALLNFVPAEVPLAAADRPDTLQAGLRETRDRRCYICHEIGNGPYYSYLWDEHLRLYFQLPTAGHMLATNLHANTLDQAHDQVCLENRVPEADFQRMNLVFFLAVEFHGLTRQRRITELWESNGIEPHQRLLADDQPFDITRSKLVSTHALVRAHQQLDAILASGARTIQQVRTAVLESRHEPVQKAHELHPPPFRNCGVASESARMRL